MIAPITTKRNRKTMNARKPNTLWEPNDVHATVYLKDGHTIVRTVFRIEVTSDGQQGLIVHTPLGVHIGGDNLIVSNRNILVRVVRSMTDDKWSPWSEA